MKKCKQRISSKQRGAILILSLIFMLLTAMIVGTLLTTSSMEMKMATNEQFRLEAAQRSEAIIDALYDAVDDGEEDGFLKERGERLCLLSDADANCVCTVNAAATGCDDGGVLPNLDLALTTVTSNELLDYYIEYMSNNVPAYAVLSEDTIGSGSFGLYEIHVEYDASESGQGKSQVVQGIMMSYGEGSDQERREYDADLYRDIAAEI